MPDTYEYIPGSSTGPWSMKKTLMIWTPIWIAIYIVLPLFLFTLSAQGQGKTTDSSVTYSSKRISLLNKFDLGIAVRYDTTAIVEVVTSLWRDYKAECDRDSVKHYDRRTEWSDIIVREPRPSAEEFLDLWLPKRMEERRK